MSNSITAEICGTGAGVMRHRKKGEPLCEPCRLERNAISRQWKAKNKATVLKAKKQYRQENLDKIQNYRRVYSVKFREVLLEKNRAWRKSNPDKYRIQNNSSSRRRRARKLNNGYSPYTLEQVLEEYGAVCYLCELPIDLEIPRSPGSSSIGLHLDHVVPLSRGGSDSLDNVAPTHARCNLTKGGK